MVTRSLSAVLMMTALLWTTAALAAIEVDVSPEPVVADQSCRITFRTTDADAGEPDFTPLEADFEILGRNRQSSLNWVNGRRSQSTTWILDAMPRHGGTLTIPAIRFGNEQSAPRSVQVAAAAPSAANKPDAEIILEAEATPKNPYVQQQVIYTVRLLHRVELSSPRFSSLETSADAVIKPLGDGRQYMTRRNGVSYDVFEQRYAIFPQGSGALRIAPLSLTTQVVQGVRSLFDPFSQSMQTRRVQSAAVELDVRPVPGAFPAGATWLPARRLRLHEEWDPDSGRVDTGNPVSRTLYLWADGLVSGQLPALRPEVPDGTKVYPDQPQTNEQDTATGFTAVRQQKFAIIASRPGTVHFAALGVPWWNTETDQLEYARLDEHSIDFEGAAPATGAAPPAAAATSEATTAAAEPLPAATAPAVPAAAPAGAPSAWMAASAVLATLWLVTLLAWWRARRPRAAVAPSAAARADLDTARAASAAKALKSACAADDAPAARAALLAWATTRAPGAPCRNLREAIARVHTPALVEALLELERALYARTPSPWRGAALWEAFRAEPRSGEAAADSPKPGGDLPNLFKLAGE